ncbi:MAG: hypothetical protein MMC33_003668 [Icmadophila ericetorum]|nr:hypothetical protein [Icmadophila ericetorum]
MAEQQQQQKKDGNEYLLILPDKEGSLQTRLKVRDEHLLRAKTLTENGTWIFGGAMLSHHPTPSETGPPPMEGSVLVAVGASEEAVMGVIREDAYVKAGVWDLEKVRCIPFRVAIQKGK